MNIAVNVLDCLHGHAATGVEVRLFRADGKNWLDVAVGRTDENGFITVWKPEFIIHRGVYRAELNLDAYFTSLGVTPFMPTATVNCRVVDAVATYNIYLSITAAFCAASISA